MNRFSVAAWFRSSVALSSNGQTMRMLEKENSFFLLSGDGNPAALGVGGISMLVKKAGANLSIGVGQSLLANRWYHVAGTFDGANIRIYLDGELKGTRAVAAPLDTTVLPLHIGADYSAPGVGTRYFNGTIDEVGIWERPLSQSEILDLSGQVGLPTILEQPQSQTAYAGGSAIFQVRARGQGPLRYLWFHGTNELRTATTPVLTLVNVQLADAGDYRCEVSNDLGDTFSDIATLTVTPVTSITDGSEALWKLDETSGLVAADSSGQGRDGQLADYVDTSSQWIAGQVNGALTFDGQSNRVVAANSGALNLGSDATLAFWVRPSSYGTLQNAGTYLFNTGRILRKGTRFDVETVDDPGTVRGTLRVNGVPAPQQNILQTNQWQHFAIVFSGGTITFYKNGFRLGDPVPGGLGATNTNAVVLGSFSETLATTTNLFAGAMDEVGIWGRILSESEILNLAGRDVAGPPVVVTQPESATRYVGGSVSFLVEATGKRPLSYGWQHDGTPMPASNTNRLVLTNLTLADVGGYTVSVTNDLNFTVSTPPAVLTILQVSNVASGLIAYWNFDETNGSVFADASSHGHDAALQNGTAVSGSVGVIGGSYNFDGVNDFAIVPHAPDLNLADQVTISVWVNPRNFGGVGGLGRMVRKDINFDFTLVAANSTFQVFGLNKAAYTAPANSLTTNQWQHLAVVARDGTLQFFKNGRALGNPIPGQLGPANLNNLIIANFGPDLSIVRLFDGFMDDLGIWNRALSASEVDGIYQNGLVGQGLNAPFVPFAIQSIGFPAPNQVRLVYYSPFTGRQHVIQRSDDFATLNWTNQTPVTLNPLGSGLTEALFDKAAGQSAFYRVAVLPQADLFFENFETGAVGWTHGGAGDEWELGTPVNGPGAAVSGVNVYATDLDGITEAFSDEWLRSPPINLAGVSRATVTFQEWRNVDPDPTFHGTIVNVLDANTLAVIQQLSLQAGATAGWQQRTLQLPPQILGRNIRLEFRLYCDGFNLLEGWYIDDVEIAPE
ncbi:MAG TPA: LamG-like jellyroll fold domain-containing protein [Candidatus Limnocylindria bacterium]|nr:LamG-like jellyroll fold domain-containing protein [Candidatus Limnocylindria bacterium]